MNYKIKSRNHNYKKTSKKNTLIEHVRILVFKKKNHQQ